MSRWRSAISAAGLMWSTAAFAQEDPTKRAQAAVAATKTEAVKFAVPENPAFTFLGLSPTKVSRPPSVHDLGAEVLNGIGADGKVKQGLAFELAPYFYLGKSISLADYQRRAGLAYAIANTRISFGTVKSQGDSASTDVALGLRVVFHDAADPMRNKAVTDLMGDKMSACPAVTPPFTPDKAKAYDDCIKAAVIATGEAAEKLESDYWNATRVAFALVSGLRLENSQIRRSMGSGTRAWLGASSHIGKRDQWIGSLTYRYNNGATSDSSFHATSLGLRLNYGGAHVNGFAEFIGEGRFNKGVAVDKNTNAWSAGVEFRATDGVWISTGFGTAYEAVRQPDNVAVLLGLRWGVAAASRLKPGT